MQLSPYAFLTLEETKEWLKIKPDNTDYDNILIRLINRATAKVENYIDGPVLTRELVEFRDGNSSNTIVPTFYPVTEIVEVRIDFNRGFGNETIVSTENIILRGMPSLSQIQGDPQIKILGSDIVLRDDNNTALLGRIFAGSVIQSIKLTYKAGRGDTAADIPDDLKDACLMLVEYYYLMRENKDVGIKSRTSMNQSYTRVDATDTDSGMPREIETLLDEFKDWSLGITDQPQKNTFTL